MRKNILIGLLPLLKQAKFIGMLFLENVRLNRELAEREAKIRRLVEANITGIVIWNLDGRLIEANEAFLSMVDYSRKDLVSGRMHWRDLTPPQWHDSDERAVAEIKAIGAFQPYEKECFRKGGGRVPVLIGGAIFEGKANEGVAFVIDLSARKRAEEALRRAESELAHVTRVTTMGELAASIAHEVKQPISGAGLNANACLHWLDQVKEDSANVTGAREALHRIIRDVSRAAGNAARINTLFKKTELAREPLDISEAIREVIELIQGEVNKKQIALQVQLAENLPPVLGDRVQMQQVVMNLILNAIDAMSTVENRERELVIQTSKNRAAQVCVEVRDSGVGFNPEDEAKIFKSFYTTKPGGMGMGLSISRSIVESHGGRLSATTNNGPGATFQFTLATHPSESER